MTKLRARTLLLSSHLCIPWSRGVGLNAVDEVWLEEVGRTIAGQTVTHWARCGRSRGEGLQRRNADDLYVV